VQDLIRKVALAEGVDANDIPNSPEEWWTSQGRSDPRYDEILQALAPTDAARQALLRGYFDPQPERGGPLLPSSGHEALAWLCATSRVRVIVTTNFDRLIERALDRVGLSTQVISSPAAVAGMIPLAHAEMTVIKLHGDYAAAGLRNSPDELNNYPNEWNVLLDQILAEYGLLVVGWSADYDGALAAAIERASPRRYPMFWASYGDGPNERARRLIAVREGTTIEIANADEFLADIKERIVRLDQVAARRGRPTALRSYSFPPEHSTALQGWTVLPLLQLSTVASVGPATLADTGIIRAGHREALVQALRITPVANGLRALAAIPASALAEGTAGTPDPLVDWQPTPGGHQSDMTATYRLGGDAQSGVSAIVRANFPGFGIQGGSILFRLDMGISIGRALSLGEAARMFRDGLLLVTSTIPEVFAEISPSASDVQLAEIHVQAAATDGNNRNRPNNLLDRLDLKILGSPTRTVGPSLGFSARLSGPLSQREAAELVVEAFDYISVASGYLDPSIALVVLRSELGLPAAG
jgi:hypothetical protein